GSASPRAADRSRISSRTSRVSTASGWSAAPRPSLAPMSAASAAPASCTTMPASASRATTRCISFAFPPATSATTKPALRRPAHLRPQHDRRPVGRDSGGAGRRRGRGARRDGCRAHPRSTGRAAGPRQPENALILDTAKSTLLAPFELEGAKLEQVFGTLAARRVDYADLYFQYSRSEGWSLEEGIVKSG